MRVRVARWGNSLAVRAPKEIARAAGLTEGASVEMTVEDEAIVIRVPRARPRYRLDALLEGMTPQAMAEAFDWGADAGRERAE